MFERPARKISVAVAGTALLVACSANAALTWFGEDIDGGSVPSRFADSQAARSAFLASAGFTGTESFESYTTGDGLMAGARPPFVMDFGVLSARITSGFGHVEVWEHALGGRYPVTGRNYLLMVGHPQLATFVDVAFAAPVRAFGFSATDVGDYAESLSLAVTTLRGGTTVLEIPHTRDSLDANAAVFFFGIVSDDPIASVRIANAPISAGTPIVAFDDMIAAPAVDPDLGGFKLPVPEASMGLLMATGLGVVALRYRRRKR
jgi:hypothetical protein